MLLMSGADVASLILYNINLSAGFSILWGTMVFLSVAQKHQIFDGKGMYYQDRYLKSGLRSDTRLIPTERVAWCRNANIFEMICGRHSSARSWADTPGHTYHRTDSREWIYCQIEA